MSTFIPDGNVEDRVNANIAKYKMEIAATLKAKYGQTLINNTVDGVLVGIEFVKECKRSYRRIDTLTGFIRIYVGRRWNKNDGRRMFKETKDHTIRVDEIVDELHNRATQYVEEESHKQTVVERFNANIAAVEQIKADHNVPYGIVDTNYQSGAIKINLSFLEPEKAEAAIVALKQAGVI
jgi:hypothetical protein